jgi:hypothetical protein
VIGQLEFSDFGGGNLKRRKASLVQMHWQMGNVDSSSGVTESLETLPAEQELQTKESIAEGRNTS